MEIFEDIGRSNFDLHLVHVAQSEGGKGNLPDGHWSSAWDWEGQQVTHHSQW